jgi:hypothetical protein
LDLLQRELRGQGLRLRWNDPQESVFEGFLSRGDRRLAAVVEQAWRKGAKFDAWADHFREDVWQEAMAEEGIDADFYTHRRRSLDEVFPWEHIDIAVTKKFLSKDYLMSLEQETRIDCRHQCFACGILPELKDLRRETPPEAWQCPPVKKRPGAKLRPPLPLTVNSIPLEVI